ncbi:unnamed protein product [Pleuronectes platessa]|uniref:Uncharacterized protein n=1 Tax=Pleuronectes platessa TaxID=8262 RepID=A0A9N7Y7Z0_PLEPL|nr:unnamed protein product [Pleuronectes platessa]
MTCQAVPLQSQSMVSNQQDHDPPSRPERHSSPQSPSTVTHHEPPPWSWSNARTRCQRDKGSATTTTISPHNTESTTLDPPPPPVENTFQSRNGEITWWATSSSEIAAALSRVCLGPTMHAKSRASDIASTFGLVIKPMVENIILEMMNQEGCQKYGDEWKGMDETDLRAYVGLLI